MLPRARKLDAAIEHDVRAVGGVERHAHIVVRDEHAQSAIAQELIVRDEDCGSTRGIWVENVTNDPDHMRFIETSLLSRVLSEDVTLADGSGLLRNTEVDEDVLEALVQDEKVTRGRGRWGRSQNAGRPSCPRPGVCFETKRSSRGFARGG